MKNYDLERAFPLQGQHFKVKKPSFFDFIYNGCKNAAQSFNPKTKAIAIGGIVATTIATGGFFTVLGLINLPAAITFGAIAAAIGLAISGLAAIEIYDQYNCYKQPNQNYNNTMPLNSSIVSNKQNKLQIIPLPQKSGYTLNAIQDLKNAGKSRSLANQLILLFCNPPAAKTVIFKNHEKTQFLEKIKAIRNQIGAEDEKLSSITKLTNSFIATHKSTLPVLVNTIENIFKKMEIPLHNKNIAIKNFSLASFYGR